MSLHAGKADGSRKQSCTRQFEISNYISLKLCSCLRLDFLSNEGDEEVHLLFLACLTMAAEWCTAVYGAGWPESWKGDGLLLSQVPEYDQ